jgi:hypothetical protein
MAGESVEGEEKARLAELLAETKRQHQQLEKARAERNRFYLNTRGAILEAKSKEARAEDIIFLDSQVTSISEISEGTRFAYIFRIVSIVKYFCKTVSLERVVRSSVAQPHNFYPAQTEV